MSIKRGIFIDIFPMDITDGYSVAVEHQKKKVLFWNGLLYTKCFSIEKNVIKKFIQGLFSEKMLLKIAEYYMKRKCKNVGQYYSNFGLQYNIKRQTHPIENFGEGIMLPFENREYRFTLFFWVIAPRFVRL